MLYLSNHKRHLEYIFCSYKLFFLIRSCFICLNSSSVISPSSFNFASFLISSAIDISISYQEIFKKEIDSLMIDLPEEDKEKELNEIKDSIEDANTKKNR